MGIARRTFLQLGALPLLPRMAMAQAYPARPARIVIGLPAGSSPDIGGRLIAQWLSERLGQQFIVDNRPGANTNLATEQVTRAAPDGYILLLAIAANAVNATLYENLRFDFKRDIAPVAGLVAVPNVMVVHPSVPARTVPEFIAYAKANPGKLNMAVAGIGGTPHVAGELFKMMAGIDMLSVPYNGNPRPDLLSGQMHVMFDTLPASIGSVRGGTLRALAVTTAKRLEVLPDVPPVADFLPGYEAAGWQGIAAPKDTPRDIVERLNKEVNAALADPGMQAKFANLGAFPIPMTPAEFEKFIAAEIEKWAKVVKFANVKAE